MLTIFLSISFIIWLSVRRTPFFIAFSFLLIGFCWRLIDAAYLNYIGSIYSYEAEMLVGGDELAAHLFGLLMFLSILVIYISIKPTSLEKLILNLDPIPKVRASFNFGDLVFIAGLFFVVTLYVDLFRIGVIPLFQCIERYEYLELYAGIFHKILFKYGSLIALQFGTFAVYPIMAKERYDWRYLILLGILFIYFTLTGNRFSSFYSISLFYFTPHCLIWLLRLNPQFEYKKNNRRKFYFFGIFFVLIIVIFSLINSYANTRYEKSKCAEIIKLKKIKPPHQTTYSAGLELNGIVSRFVKPEVQIRIQQRILVQPIHMYFITYDRVINNGDWKPSEAAKFIFDLEHAPYSNRSIRYLMNRTLPETRAAYLESVGNQFAGGYPEVLLELMGEYGAFIGVILFAAVTGYLMNLWLKALLQGYFITAFFASYVFYAFFVMYIGGMLNFLVVWTFWMKVFFLVLFSFLEPLLKSRGQTLIPWHLGLALNLKKFYK